MMDSLGEFFRQAREARGLTLDEVASKTRIHPAFLMALEEGNFAKLPDQVFAKGFVRSYARSLGLDEEEAIRRFSASAGAFYEQQVERERLRLKQAEEERRKKANRNVVVAAAGVALLVLVFLLTRDRSPVVPNRVPGDLEQSRTAPAARATNNPPAVGSPAEGPSESMSLASAANEPQDQLPLEGVRPDKAPLILDLEATELSWVVVQVDGTGVHEALLRPGDRVRWKASEQFTITLGNAGGVRVELNGKLQGPFGPSGKVARDIVLKR